MRCPELINCPKICIVQACRGTQNMKQALLNFDDAVDALDKNGQKRYHSAADRAVLWAGIDR